MKLTGFNTEGDINVPILGVTTNGQMADAILNAFTARFYPNVVKRTREVKEYVKRLNNEPEKLFFDPCYELCNDAFVCSFNFEKE